MVDGNGDDHNHDRGMWLWDGTLATIGVTTIVPWTPLTNLLGFQPLPLSFVLVLGAIVVFYVTAAENVKRVFYQPHEILVFKSQHL